MVELGGRYESEVAMPQDRETGIAAMEYGLETARRIAKVVGATKIGRPRSNEYELNGKKIVFKCARLKTKSVGVPYHMLARLSAVIGCFKLEGGVYELYEMTPEMYRENMRPTRSKGSSSGRVGIVNKSIFISHCRKIGVFKL